MIDIRQVNLAAGERIQLDVNWPRVESILVSLKLGVLDISLGQTFASVGDLRFTANGRPKQVSLPCQVQYLTLIAVQDCQGTVSLLSDIGSRPQQWPFGG